MPNPHMTRIVEIRPRLEVIETPAHERRRHARRCQLAYWATLAGILGLAVAAWAMLIGCVVLTLAAL